MDPKQALDDCLRRLLAKDYLDATTSLDNYLGWRAKGGFCPTGYGPDGAPHDGDKQASLLADMLRACWAPANPPGKFEGEPGYTVLLYEARLNGDGEYIDAYEGDNRTVHTVDLAMRAIWPELSSCVRVMIGEQDNGFVWANTDQGSIQREIDAACESGVEVGL